jgi:uncharacterized protein YecE (DUF72 family)
VRERFAGEGSHLERYARVFNAVEINQTFYRPPRASTLARWAASVPRGFRFSVKMPRAITHEARLTRCGKALDAFLESLAPLGDRLGCVLVQLPPSLEWNARTANAFFTRLRERYDGAVVAEPRHATWFDARVESVLERHRIARVAADPPRASNGFDPAGARETAYFRLHGSPRVYFSWYEDAFLDDLARRLRGLAREGVTAWCIFDNTAHAGATSNALGLRDRMAARARR